LKMDLNVNENCPKTVKIGVYTAAYRKIYEETRTVTNREVWTWAVQDSKGTPIASGVYYIRVQEEGSGTVMQWSPFVVLR
jgi:hypothetical protein